MPAEALRVGLEFLAPPPHKNTQHTHTHTRTDPIRLLYIQLALPLPLLLPPGSATSERLTVGVPLWALWLAGIFLRRKERCADVVRTHTDWVLKGEGGVMTTPLLEYVSRFDGGGEIVGSRWRDCKESRSWCSLFVGSPSFYLLRQVASD